MSYAMTHRDETLLEGILLFAKFTVDREAVRSLGFAKVGERLIL